MILLVENTQSLNYFDIMEGEEEIAIKLKIYMNARL